MAEELRVSTERKTLLDLVKALVGEDQAEFTKRIIIDIDSESFAKLYIERYADKSRLQVFANLTKDKFEIVREPKEDVTDRNSSDRTEGIDVGVLRTPSSDGGES